MKYYVLLAVWCTFFFSCKPKQKSSSSSSTATTAAENSVTGIPAVGKVSHSYKTSGCGTVIVVAKSSTDSLILIPRQSLNEFDKDGLQISFSYKILRMHNPPGCGTGMPAEVSNISKK